MSKATSIIATVTLEADGSYSIGIEDDSQPEDSEERYITGLSEGHEFDPARAGSFAGQLIADYLAEPPMQSRNSSTGEPVAFA